MPTERTQAQGRDGNFNICHALLKKAILLHIWPKAFHPSETTDFSEIGGDRVKTKADIVKTCQWLHNGQNVNEIKILKQLKWVFLGTIYSHTFWFLDAISSSFKV